MRISRGQPITVILIAVLITASLPLFIKAVKAADTPPIPHPVSGHEKCLLCHSATGTNHVPASHMSFDENMCQGCHSEAAPPPATSENTTATTTAPVKQSQDCNSCHGQSTLSMNITTGERLSLFVNPDTFAVSIHGGKLLCIDCHTAITGYPHPKREISSLRENSLTQFEVCKRCHFDNYTKTLDSVHYQKLTEGDIGTPLCTDCHSAHEVTSPAQPRTKISQACSQCHQVVYDQYVRSVHGEALITENNYDVPVCTDCHLSHTIEDPRTASFRVKSVDLCINCHDNEELMQKYDISTNVVKTYLKDFHGASLALLSKQTQIAWPQEAVCTDCHGVHDIRTPDDPESTVMKANLVQVCQQCHESANINFPGAWLSHYEPSLERAPIVFWVRWFYLIGIPFIVIGLGIHVLIDLWRVVTNR